MRRFTPGFDTPNAVDRSNPVQTGIGNKKIARRFQTIATDKTVNDIKDAAM
jgi:hypothetical protein